MARNTKISNAVVNAQADALARLLDNGYLRIYSGIQPVTANTALSGNTLLAELRFADPSAPAAVAGVLTFSSITPDASANASGTASFYRCFQSDGTSVVMDGNIGIAGENLDLNSTDIVLGDTVSIGSFVHTLEKTSS